jgi:hypothetical protein
MKQVHPDGLLLSLLAVAWRGGFHPAYVAAVVERPLAEIGLL